MSSDLSEEAKKAKALRFGAAFRTFDRGLMIFIDQEKKRLQDACSSVEKRIKKCEKTVMKYVSSTKEATDRDIKHAEELVQRELRSKVIMSQWTTMFLAKGNDEILDPLSFGFARFALNICLSYATVSPDYLVSSKVHFLLVSLVGFKQELIIGPALMACMHLSLYESLKEELINAGILPILLRVMIESESQPILTQACKLAASLAVHSPNKSRLAVSGCLHVLFDLVGAAHKLVLTHAQRAATNAVTNIIYNCEANKVLTVDLDGIRPVLNAIRRSSDELTILHAVRALVNISYANGYTSMQILMLGGDVALIDVLNSCDILSQADTTQAALACLSNLCITETSQAHIASSSGAIEVAIRICKHAKHLKVIYEAANLMIALSFRNTGNKARLAAEKACEVLYDRIIEQFDRPSIDPMTGKDDLIICFECLCRALSSLMLYSTNHERFMYTE